jgi:hypothetical protein
MLYWTLRVYKDAAVECANQRVQHDGTNIPNRSPFHSALTQADMLVALLGFDGKLPSFLCQLKGIAGADELRRSVHAIDMAERNYEREMRGQPTASIVRMFPGNDMTETMKRFGVTLYSLGLLARGLAPDVLHASQRIGAYICENGDQVERHAGQHSRNHVRSPRLRSSAKVQLRRIGSERPRGAHGGDFSNVLCGHRQVVRVLTTSQAGRGLADRLASAGSTTSFF